MNVGGDELHAAVTVVMVDLGLEGDVEGLLLEHLLLELSHAKAHASDRAGVVGDGELEVVALGIFVCTGLAASAAVLIFSLYFAG